MKVTGSCHCGTITIEGEADPEKVGICHCTDCQTGTGSAFRVSVPIPGNIQDEGPADQLSEDHGGQRQSARAGVLPEMRLADLFDHAGRRPAGVLHGAGRHSAQRDQLAPKKQNWFRSARSWVTGMDGIHKNEKQA